MRLLRLQVCHLGPFPFARFSFADDGPIEEGPQDATGHEQARCATVIHGPAGTGKTTLLAAIAATRPGCINPLHQRRSRPSEDDGPAEPPTVVADWALGQDDPERPHVLRLATPGTRVFLDDREESVRRREQVLFDKIAREQGFAWATLPGHRWFSRQPISLNAPSRPLGAYDVRSASLFDEGTRADLTRETKQALAYAAVTAALNSRAREPESSLDRLGEAMTEVVEGLARLAGVSYLGLDAVSLEPQFRAQGQTRYFDELPNQARHLVAMGALTMRAMWAAHPGRDPRDSEGVAAIDEIDLHQDPAAQASLVPTLRELMPNVQWIVTTSSGLVAASVATHEVLALRRLPERDQVDVFVGTDARTH